jgi:hypothetical protein
MYLTCCVHLVGIKNEITYKTARSGKPQNYTLILKFVPRDIKILFTPTYAKYNTQWMATFGKFRTSKAILFVHTLLHKSVLCIVTCGVQMSNGLSCSHMPFATTAKWEGKQRGWRCIRGGTGWGGGGGGTTQFQYKTNTTWVSKVAKWSNPARLTWATKQKNSALY